VHDALYYSEILVEILLMQWDELLQFCYEWQGGNLKWEDWVINQSKETNEVGKEYIWLDREGRALEDACQIKTMCFIYTFKENQVEKNGRKKDI